MVGNRCVPVISGVTLVLCHSDLYFSFGFSDVLLFERRCSDHVGYLRQLTQQWGRSRDPVNTSLASIWNR